MRGGRRRSATGSQGGPVAASLEGSQGSETAKGKSIAGPQKAASQASEALRRQGGSNGFGQAVRGREGSAGPQVIGARRPCAMGGQGRGLPGTGPPATENAGNGRAVCRSTTTVSSSFNGRAGGLSSRPLRPAGVAGL